MRVDRRSVAALALPGGPAPPTSAEPRNPDRDAYSAETHIDSRYNWAGVATDSEYVGVAQLANEPGLAASELPASAAPDPEGPGRRAELNEGPVRRQSIPFHTAPPGCSGSRLQRVSPLMARRIRHEPKRGQDGTHGWHHIREDASGCRTASRACPCIPSIGTASARFHRRTRAIHATDQIRGRTGRNATRSSPHVDMWRAASWKWRRPPAHAADHDLRS